MADILQRVFLIFVRPVTVINNETVIRTTNLKVQTGTSVVQYGNEDVTVPVYTEVKTNNSSGDITSSQPLNEGATYQKDPWMLHSTYTSYEEFRINLRILLNSYPSGAILTASYIPTSYIVTPFE